MSDEEKIKTKVTKKGKKDEESAPKEKLTLKQKLELARKAIKDPGDLVGIASELDLDYGKISTGFQALDIIADGGWPRGKYSIIAGPEQSYKTTLLLYTIAHEQRVNPETVWVWVDAEHSFDRNWAAKCGVNLDNLLYIGPGILEDVMQNILDILETGVVDGIVVDSVAALVPQAEMRKKKDDKGLTRELKDDSVAALAKKAGQFFRMATPAVAKYKPAVIMIGHVYVPIGDDYKEWELKGGNALKYWSHFRIMSNRRKGAQDRKIKVKSPSGQEREIFAGYEAVFKIDKTRQGAHANHEVSIPFLYGVGLSNQKSVLDMAFAFGVIQGAGAWFSHPLLPNGKMQGRENVEVFFQENSEAFSTLLEEVGSVIARDSV